MSLVLIGLGGFAGAIARYLVDGVVADRTGGGFPWGTLVVNVSGSFLLGLLFALIAERAILPAEIRGPLMIGFLGAYTTFSTFMLESWRLVEAGAWGPAARQPRRLDRPRARRGRRRADAREGDLMRIDGPALLVRIYIGEADHHGASRSTRRSSSSCASAGSPARPSCAASRASGRTPTSTRPASCDCPRTCRS